MSFRDRLETQRPPERIGEVRLRYEDSLLVGERARRRALWPELAGVLALAAGLGALALLLVSGPLLAVGALALLAAALVGLSVAARGRQRIPERFVLNFATESLRLDGPDRTGRASSEVVPFDAVRDLEVVPTGPGQFGLLLEYTAADGEVRQRLLVRHGPAAEVETLRHGWRVLKRAFGL